MTAGRESFIAAREPMALILEQLLALAGQSALATSATGRALVAGAGVVSLVVFSFFCKFVYRAWILRGIPGPLPLPFVGHLYLPEAPAVLRFLSTCRRKYGRVFHFWPGNSSLIVVAEPVAARAILTDGRKFVKGPDYTEKFSVCFGEGLVTSRDPKHKRDRACLGRYLTRDAVLRHLRMMQALTETAMDE